MPLVKIIIEKKMSSQASVLSLTGPVIEPGGSAAARDRNCGVAGLRGCGVAVTFRSGIGADRTRLHEVFAFFSSLTDAQFRFRWGRSC